MDVDDTSKCYRQNRHLNKKVRKKNQHHKHLASQPFEKSKMTLELVSQLLIDAEIKKQYFTRQSRKASFNGWRMYKGQTPEILADAGFFQTECGAQVQCYECGFRVFKRNVGADPLEDHTRMNPNCQLVKMKESTIEVVEAVHMCSSGEHTELNSSTCVHQCQENRNNHSLHQKIDSFETMSSENVSTSLVTNTDDYTRERCLHKKQTISVQVCFPLEPTMSIFHRGTNRVLKFKTKYKGYILYTSFGQSWNEDRCSLFHQRFSFKKKPHILTETLIQDWEDFRMRNIHNLLLLQTLFGLFVHLNRELRQADTSECFQIVVS
ncbi:uncharacterized protein LOC143076253 isoform X2 [Mytilus galloprovincialis]|uniref:uncharacterized protein LOC143076253 isoform X2 n=1 Tax=Mytilus galloprovincialis TaxID=29158 RepID=UPI003F7C01BD